MRLTCSFVGLGIDDVVWVLTVFTKNRDRLLTTDVSRMILVVILAHREVVQLLSDDHSSVDGTLVRAWCQRRASSRRAMRCPIGTTTSRAHHPREAVPSRRFFSGLFS